MDYGTGDSRYRGLVKITEQAHDSVSKVEDNDTLLLDSSARSDARFQPS